MRTWIGTSIAVSALLVVFVPAARPQQPAPQVNPVPLERPMPLARVRSADPQQVMRAVSEVVARYSFQPDRVEASAIDARRFDAATRTDAEAEYDRVVIWLERDFEKPLEYVNVYFAWGRYELIVGRERGVRRVVPWSERDIPKLRASIAALAQQ